MISALEKSGEASYDRVRETLKHVSVDASGKLEVDDYVDVMNRPQTVASNQAHASFCLAHRETAFGSLDDREEGG